MTTPQLIVCMGVSASGKSTLARALADDLDWQYLDADDFHSESNRQKMACGEPLDDDDRAPWMQAITLHLKQRLCAGTHCVLAHSGLRRQHREQLRTSGFDVRFVFLDGHEKTIADRLRNRRGHYMPPTLLESQYAALQRPDDEPDVITLDCTQPINDLVRVTKSVSSDSRTTTSGY